MGKRSRGNGGGQGGGQTDVVVSEGEFLELFEGCDAGEFLEHVVGEDERVDVDELLDAGQRCDAVVVGDQRAHLRHPLQPAQHLHLVEPDVEHLDPVHAPVCRKLRVRAELRVHGGRRAYRKG